MSPDEKIKHLLEYVKRLELRVNELEQFKADVLRTIMSPVKGQEVTKND